MHPSRLSQNFINPFTALPTQKRAFYSQGCSCLLFSSWLVAGHCIWSFYVLSYISTFALSFLLKSVFSRSGEPHCPGYFCPVHSLHWLPVPALRVPSPSLTAAQIFPGSLPRLHYYPLSFPHPSIKCDTGVIFSSTESMFHIQIIRQVTTLFVCLYICLLYQSDAADD